MGGEGENHVCTVKQFLSGSALVLGFKLGSARRLIDTRVEGVSKAAEVAMRNDQT